MYFFTTTYFLWLYRHTVLVLRREIRIMNLKKFMRINNLDQCQPTPLPSTSIGFPVEADCKAKGTFRETELEVRVTERKSVLDESGWYTNQDIEAIQKLRFYQEKKIKRRNQSKSGVRTQASSTTDVFTFDQTVPF